ncbi:hypothetical protein KA977_04015 [Candidatus Dependentiae bacterium]|nr:hypothetical protein [Candidatus Dependentiae bacterium]
MGNTLLQTIVNQNNIQHFDLAETGINNIAVNSLPLILNDTQQVKSVNKLMYILQFNIFHSNLQKHEIINYYTNAIPGVEIRDYGDGLGIIIYLNEDIKRQSDISKLTELYEKISLIYFSTPSLNKFGFAYVVGTTKTNNQFTVRQTRKENKQYSIKELSKIVNTYQIKPFRFIYENFFGNLSTGKGICRFHDSGATTTLSVNDSDAICYDGCVDNQKKRITLEELFLLILNLNYSSDYIAEIKSILPHTNNKRPKIFFDELNETIEELRKKITGVLYENNNIFLYGELLYYINYNKGFILDPNQNQQWFFEEIFDFFQVRVTKSGVLKLSKLLDSGITQTYLKSPTEKLKFETIESIVYDCMYDYDFSILKKKYNKNQKIYVFGEEIKYSNSTYYINELLYDFCFKTSADRVNYIAILLTILFPQNWRGRKPCLILNANQSQLGKSYLAKIAGILADNRIPVTISYHADEEEMEKQLATFVQDQRVIIIDNAKNPRAQEISSSILERSITDQILNYRKLGKNEPIRRPNDCIFIFTMNNSRFSQDLLNRAITVNLYFEGEATERNFKHNDILNWTLKNRKNILAELFGIVEVARNASKLY